MIHTKKIRRFLPCAAVLGSALLLLSACQLPERKAQVVTSPDKVSLMMAEAADKASTSLEALAAIEQQKSPGVAVQPISNAPEELARAITITWVGPPEQILRKLADRASYNFVTLGNRPPVPLVINVDVQNQPVIEVLRDVGLQLGVRGDVKVDADKKIIELHYAPVTGVGG
ncbi:MAG: hypothetical protein DI551_00265 [Micavibrio aeruginosavorus]|uniref:DotD/TraH family lipoprotein n=1 Tax=Micavibrio aeruginosavorus TaxID=349221 RepID=A0A2W5NA08_9BACT|nr:MAG: hypothetical protein DI551_00265 [Micavibrio aeruginosavorus]